MGIHRNVIHPKFGNFILLGTVLMDAEVGHDESTPSITILASNANSAWRLVPYPPSAPMEGSISRPASPITIASSWAGLRTGSSRSPTARDALDYRKRISEPETASMWQSLSFGANYKSAYCMAVCPAGEDVIGPYLQTAATLKEVVEPLQEKAEPVYVVKGSDAEAIRAEMEE